MSEYSRALGDTVRAARKKMGLSQNKVAALIDADERTIMNIETYNANTTMTSTWSHHCFTSSFKSAGFVVISRYSSVSCGNLSTNGTMVSP